MLNLSQIVVMIARDPKIARYRHGIDFKNPFTMSKRGQIPHVGANAEPGVFIIWNC